MQYPSPVTFAPTEAPAARYNDAQPPMAHTALGDAVIAAAHDVAVRARLPEPQPDARLFQACADLAELALKEDTVGYKPIEFAMHYNGIIDANPQVLFLRVDTASPGPIVKELEPWIAEALRDGASARLGVAVAGHDGDGTQVVAFALLTSGVSTLPIPRAVRAGDRIVIDAVIDPRYHDPEVFVMSQSGATQQVGLDPGRPGGFIVQLACGSHEGRQQIEISASDTAGPVELANFPVWCATQPPLAITIDPLRDEPPVTAPEQVERRLLASVNHDRATVGLPALIWDDAVAAVARGYSEEMRGTRVVAHISSTSGAAADRLRAANIRAAKVFENVARAYGVNEAHEGLMNSPGHRANILSPSATHVGIGVTFGEANMGQREMFITELFTRPAPRFDRGHAVAAVRRKLAAARPSLAAAARLDGLAQQLADTIATGKTIEVAYDALRSQLDGLGDSYEPIGKAITVVADLDKADEDSLLGRMTAAEFGLGIAQGSHPQLGHYAIWVVILLANRRP